jgi:hypothetical protein
VGVGGVFVDIAAPPSTTTAVHVHDHDDVHDYDEAPITMAVGCNHQITVSRS